MQEIVDRRDFLLRTAGTLALLLSERGLAAAQTMPDTATPGPPVRFAVIGVGALGRELLSTLGRMPAAQVMTICDPYEPVRRRAAASAPRATGVADCRHVLDNADVEAVIIATPTASHRELACGVVGGEACVLRSAARRDARRRTSDCQGRAGVTHADLSGRMAGTRELALPSHADREAQQGVFCAEKVYRSIDGREVVKPHGRTDKDEV